MSQSPILNEENRLLLNQMIASNNVSDQTELIRELRHSSRIKEEVDRLVQLLKEYETLEYNDIRTICTFECNFLFTYYTDIFNRVLKKEINLDLFDRFLFILQKIENGELNQHEASFQVGTILKEIYVDSALKKSKKLEEQFEASNQTSTVSSSSSSSLLSREPPKQISYKDFKSKKY